MCFVVGCVPVTVLKHFFPKLFIKSEQNMMNITLQVKYLTHRRNNIFIYMFQSLHLLIVLAEFQEQFFQERIHKSYKRTFIKEHLCVGFF